MATLHQRRLKSLMFGYININYTNEVPVELISIIQLFYDDYFHWRVQGDEMKKLLNTKNGKLLYNTSTFEINDIEFVCGLYPNGIHTNAHSDTVGFVHLCIEIKTIPSNIEQFTMFLEFGCDTFQAGNKAMVICTDECKFFNGLCTLAQCQNLAVIDFSCLVRILHIKYKEDSDNEIIDFRTEIKMNKYVEYEWKIDDEQQMERIRNMHIGMGECSDNIDNNNWVIKVQPVGFGPEYPGKLSIGISCLAVPFGIKTMRIKYKIVLIGKHGMIQEEESENEIIFVKTTAEVLLSNRMCMQCPNVEVDELFNQDWIGINVTIEIMDIYDANDVEIDRGE